jgi:hypothetical protein
MANEAWINKGTAKTVGGGGTPDVAWGIHGLASNAGRVSAQIDWGTLPRPARYEWSCEAQWQATPSQGGVLELYIATAPESDSTQIDGDVGASDAALGDVDMRRNLRAIGAVVSENAAASEVCVASGEFTCTSRYMTIVGYNNGGGSAALNATASNFVFIIQPVYWQGQ